MKFTLGFSPCPNDTFIFDALVNRKIDTQGIDFEVVMEDVETLNAWAAQGKLDITKLSFPALFANLSHYHILSSGSALGKGVGPLLIAKTLAHVPDVPHCSVAVPGVNTTAHFLLQYAMPLVSIKKHMLFSKIEDAVLNEEVDLGVIIHENRFTYQQKGLVKVLDLGAFWEEKTGTPVPLGCIAMRRSIDPFVQRKVDRLIRASMMAGSDAYPVLSPFIKEHAQEMDEDVMRKHIELYVNDFSLDLGEEGRNAIRTLYDVYRAGNHSNGEEKLFL